MSILIPNYPNYKITLNGRVFSIKSKKYIGNYTDNQGYKTVRVYKDNDCKGKYIKIHRLLAELFIENPLNLPFVDHYDKNRSNNCLSNLRWISPRDNCCNHKVYPQNTTGHNGITLLKNGSYQVSININNKRTRKNFKTLEEAIKHRKNLEELHYNN